MYVHNKYTYIQSLFFPAYHERTCSDYSPRGRSLPSHMILFSFLRSWLNYLLTHSFTQYIFVTQLLSQALSCPRTANLAGNLELRRNRADEDCDPSRGRASIKAGGRNELRTFRPEWRPRWGKWHGMSKHLTYINSFNFHNNPMTQYYYYLFSNQEIEAQSN